MRLVLSNVSFEYRAGRPVLRNTSTAIAQAQVTVVVGPNGSGKSTLLRVLLGTLVPTSGDARGDGKDLHRIPARHRAARLAYIPQSSTLAEAFTVQQVVALGRYARPTNRDAITTALSTLKLSDLADEPFHTLSAGQQQRVTLARALAQLAGGDIAPSDQAILADEPCAAMDPRHALHAMSLLRTQAARGRAVVIVLHDFTAALRFADRALVLDQDGRLAADGPTADALAPATLARTFGVAFDRLGATSSTAALVPRLLDDAPTGTIPSR